MMEKKKRKVSARSRRRGAVEKDIGKIISDRVLIDKALARAAREAWTLHARAGVPVSVWDRGRVRLVDARTLLRKKG